jgi:HAD superfamily hydrolase (TIGR01509 family)
VLQYHRDGKRINGNRPSNHMISIKAIVFDMDGLMIDSERLYFQTQHDIASRYGKKVTDQLLWRMMGRKPIESVKIFIRDLNIRESAEAVLELRNEMMRKKLKTELAVMPGLNEIIRFFSSKINLGIATGASKEFLDIVVDKLGIRNHFLVLQASDEIINGKPDPEIYLTACQKLGVFPPDCVVLEDSENGVWAGKNAGCYVIAVPSEYTRAQDFSPADIIVNNLIEAKEHIDDLITASAGGSSQAGEKPRR